MTPVRLTYVRVAVDARDPAPPGLATWEFTLAIDDADLGPGVFFACSGRADVMTQDHAWGAAIAYYTELGYQVVEIVEGSIP